MAEFIKTYTRETVAGAYNVNNPARLDGGSLQICLAKEIETALPGKKFVVRCNGTAVKIVFKDADISAGEKTTLDTVINDHKNNL